MPNYESTQSLLASTAQAASGAGAAVDLGTRDRLLRQTLQITAASGGDATLDVRLESSPDGVNEWRPFGSFTQVAGAAQVQSAEKLTFISPDRYARVAWTIAGTAAPSFTFDVGGTRGLVYANLDQLDQFGMPVDTLLVSRTSSQLCEALAAASEKADGKLGLRYTLPIVTWGLDVTEAVCKIAAYDALSLRGFDPEGKDDNVRKRYDDAMKWLADVADSHVNPVGIVDSTPDEDDDGVFMSSYPARRWV